MEKKKIELSDKEAQECYNSPDAAKTMLEKNFPFLKGDIKTKCTTLAQLFELAGESEIMFDRRTIHHSSQAKGIELGELLARVLNEGLDHMECFYYPWFKKFKDASCPSGFSLSDYSYDFSYSYAYVSSRQKFKDFETMKHAVAYFPEVFEMVLIS